MKFFAIDTSADAMATGYATNVNVLKQQLQAQVSLSFVVQVNIGQLEGLSTVEKPVTHRPVKTADREAEEVRYRMTMAPPGSEPLTLAATQYYTVKGKDLYVITCITTADQADKYAPIFEKMGQGFRLL